MTDISLVPVTDLAALGARWQALEAASNCAFFQGWTWTGCLAEERFPDPVLLEAREQGQIVALALFNRRRRIRETLILGETGDADHDSPFIEYNGVLLAASAAPGLEAACLRAARHQPIGSTRSWLPRRLRLSGIGPATLAAAAVAGPVDIRRRETAPFIDLAALREAGRVHLDTLSANTRYQLRRSARAYAARGPLLLQRASTPAEAHAFLDELVPLHQATWMARGHRGAFAPEFFGRFHHALIDRGMARGEIDLLRIAAGDRLVGLLYNFRYKGRALAYQGGFDYAGAGRHQKPGLTCHHLAIRFSAAKCLDCYDFLAGEARYKRSLATGETQLYWAVVGTGTAGRLTWQMARSLRRVALAWRQPSANFTDASRRHPDEGAIG